MLIFISNGGHNGGGGGVRDHDVSFSENIFTALCKC